MLGNRSILGFHLAHKYMLKFLSIILYQGRFIQMSFDYFGEGLSEKTGIKFTEQQQMFFKNKLPFLDPNRKMIIQTGDALGLLKFAGLPQGTAKKIFDNLKLTGKTSIDYTEMKKILRGVALAQNKIQPSSININANIKTKLPQFYDDSQDEQQKQTSPNPQVKSPAVDFFAQPSKTLQAVPNPKSVGQSPPIQKKSSQNQVANTQGSLNIRENPKAQAVQQSPSEDKKSQLAKNAKKFDEFWETLSTQQGVKISGNQVKKLFGKSENRKQLSKIWKLCCNTYKGSLSKGELYVFISLMKSKSGAVPNSLTPQMKQIIAKIDSQNNHKAKPKGGSGNHIDVDNNFFDVDKSQNFNQSQQVKRTTDTKVEKNSGEPNRMSAAISDFDDFANFANQNKAAQNPKQIQSSQEYKETEQRKQRPKQYKNPNVQPVQMKAPQVTKQQVRIPEVPKQIHEHPKQLVQSVYTSSARQLQQLVSIVVPQLEILSQQNKQSGVILEQTNLILNNVEQAHAFFVNKLNEMKVAQDDMNHRLNMTCIRMRDVIVKQTQLINSMFGVLESETQMGNGRLATLEAYCQQIEGKANAQVNKINQIQQSRKNKTNGTAHNQSHPHDYVNQRNSIQAIQPPHEAHQDGGDMYNKKSLQSMREMTQSMAVKKPNNKKSYQSIEAETGGGIYRQKLMQQLRQQQRAHQQNPNTEESSAHESVKGRTSMEGGYHWDIPDRQQIGKAHNENNQQLKQVDSEQSEEDEAQARSRQRRYRQQISQEKQKQEKALQAQQKAQALAQQQAQFLAQQQAQISAQQQAQAIAQQQAQIQAQQAKLQNALQAQLQAQSQQQVNEIDEAERNIKMKRVRLVQMINYISPITPQALPIISQKIEQMQQSLLDATYAKLYKYNYLPKLEEEQRNAQKGQQSNVVEMPNQDEFSSNNFKNEQATQQQPTFFF